MNWRGFEIELNSTHYRGMVEVIPICKTDDVESTRIGIFKDGKWQVATIDLRASTPGEIGDHILRLSPEWARQLLEGLEKLLGSPKATATESELGATKYHLEDMRQLVFHTIEEGGKDN